FGAAIGVLGVAARRGDRKWSHARHGTSAALAGRRRHNDPRAGGTGGFPAMREEVVEGVGFEPT
ncbi:MAG: hypothetical protein ACK4MF_09065, partial [Hyphomicrobiaceae bacterium]